MKRVIVQAGHNHPLEPGFEGGTGTFREAEYTRLVQGALCDLLQADARFDPIPIPGQVPRLSAVDAFVSIHGDGSGDPRASGFCFGYPEHPVNRRLATLIGEEYRRIPGCPPHRRDNYTGNLRGYYAFSRVKTDGPELLHEGGFLTNPGERLWMFGNITATARAIYVALCRYYGYTPYHRAAAKRRKVLRDWLLRRRALGWSWDRLKATANWREYKRLGGR